MCAPLRKNGAEAVTVASTETLIGGKAVACCLRSHSEPDYRFCGWIRIINDRPLTAVEAHFPTCNRRLGLSQWPSLRPHSRAQMDENETDSLVGSGNIEDECDSHLLRRTHAARSSTLSISSVRPSGAGWQRAACGGFFVGIASSLLVILLLNASLRDSPSHYTAALTAPASCTLKRDWVPAKQPLWQDRAEWLEDTVPLHELYALQHASGLHESPKTSTAEPQLALRSFFANYTRFHARSMRSLGAHTKFVISRARGYHEQGMGNRLLAVASAFLLAAVTDRVFIVDWSHTGDGFDLGDAFDEPPIDWRISQLEQHYGKDAIVEAEGQAANHITATEYWQASSATYEALLCGSLDRWQGSDSPQVMLVDSNQFFAPLLWHNPKLRARLEAWGFSTGQLGMWVLRYLFHPVAAVRQEMDEIKAKHWRPYMIGVQLRTQDGHASSNDITSLAYRCALLLTDALPLPLKQNGHIGWFLATDNEKTLELGQRLLANFSHATGLPAPDIVYAPCYSAFGVSTAVSKIRCALVHMALLGEVDDIVISKASTFGEIGHVISGLAPMALTNQLTCLRQPVADPCFHHWHYVRRLQCFAQATVSLEDINGRCIGEGAKWPT